MDRAKKPPNTLFEDWISSAAIYIGYARYGQLGGHGFVVATKYDADEELARLVEELDAGDNEALSAAKKIEAMDCWYANHPDPAIAMQLLMGKLREFQRVLDDEQQRRNPELVKLRQLDEYNEAERIRENLLGKPK